METMTASEMLKKFNEKMEVKTMDAAIENSSFYDRNIVINEIDSEVGNGVENVIRFWNRIDDEEDIPIEKRKPIKIYIDSPGGDLTATLTMIDAIALSKTPIWTINIGMAYSGGFFTFIAGHRRFSYPHASFMFHEGSASTGGTSGQFQNFSDFYKKQLEQLKALVLSTSNITNEEYENIRRDDVWYTAQEAFKKGMIDVITDNFI
jgi:ATP-dependent Clp protease protease subunit